MRSWKNEDLRQIWKRSHLDSVPEVYREFATESSRDKKDKRELKALHKEIGKRLDKLKQMRLTHLEVLGGFESDE